MELAIINAGNAQPELPSFSFDPLVLFSGITYRF